MSRLRFASFATALVVAAASSVALSAQAQSRPTELPPVTAENEAWYLEGAPVEFAGDVYYRAGAIVYFNGNTMVRSGYFNGVPLYSDATLEPYSLVFVPLPQGQMQPYERLRRGELAGTTGSRTPSFPVALVPEQRGLPMAATAPTSLRTTAVDEAVGTSGIVQRPAVTPLPAASQPVVWKPAPPEVTLRRAESNDGIWLEYGGARWISAGRAVAWDAAAFRKVGEYSGFPVYERAGESDLIYLPVRDGVLTPYKRKAL